MSNIGLRSQTKTSFRFLLNAGDWARGILTGQGTAAARETASVAKPQPKPAKHPVQKNADTNAAPQFKYTAGQVASMTREMRIHAFAMLFGMHPPSDMSDASINGKLMGF